MMPFEKEVKKRVLWITLFAALSGLTVIFALIVKLSGSMNGDIGLSAETLVGFLVGVECISIYRILAYRKALSSRERLEELHIRETDERNRIVTLKTCRSCIYLTFTLLGFAGIIASFINQTVFYTIGAVLIVLLVLYLVLMVYYSRKF